MFLKRVHIIIKNVYTKYMQVNLIINGVKKCSIYKSMQNASVKESREYKRFAKKIIKLQKIYNEVCIEQAKINRYGCNAKILLASKINELHTDGNRLEQCVKCCNEKTQCAFYTTTDIFLDKVMRRQGDSGILDLAKMARHKKNYRT